MLRTRRSAVLSFVRASALAVSLTLVLGACKGAAGSADPATKDGAPKPVDATPVEVAQASHRPIAASYAGTAPLEARAESQVVAKTSGVALQVLVEEGQQVRAGQVLVRLDPDRARLQAAQSAAQMRKLEANYNRSTQLAAQKLISANEMDQLKYDLENARALNNMANLELSYAGVQAPISGIIASRDIKPGNFVQINTPIFRIVDNSRLEATLKVPERELATIRKGQPVTLLADALPGKTFAGTVDRVSPVVDAGSGTFRVVCTVAGDQGLQPGMFGRLRIDYDQRADALVVPRAALLDDDDSDPAVYAVRDNKATRVSVKLGYLDGQWAEIREGLKPGDSVVTAGKIALREGSPVQVIGAKGRAAPARVVNAADGKAQQ